MSSDAEHSVSMDESCDSCSSESDQANSSSDHESGEMGCSYRKNRRVSRYENFVNGSARSVYQVRSKDLEEAFEMPPPLEGVCSSCASGLSGIGTGFFKLKQQRTELCKRKTKLPHPKHLERQHYCDINAQNEWLCGIRQCWLYT